MKKSSTELKDMAKERLTGHYGLLIGALCLISGTSLIVSLLLEVAFAGNSIFTFVLYLICTVIVSLLLTIFTTGYIKMLLNISRGQNALLGDLAYGFSHQPDRVILLVILTELIAAACVLPGILLLIFGVLANFLPVTVIGILVLLGGCILAFCLLLSYSQVYCLYLDAPEKGVIQLMRESRHLMKGHKIRLFYLDISFLGLILLSALTCFLGMFWLMPYMGMTSIQLYRNLLGEI